MSRYKGCCFRTQSALSQAYWLEASLDSLGHFFFAEIPFRTNQNQGIFTRYDCFLQEFLFAFITFRASRPPRSQDASE